MAKVRMKTIVSRSKVFRVIKESPWSTVHDIHRETGLSKGVVRRHVATLLEEGRIKSKKKKLRRHVSATVYAVKDYTGLPKWSILFDGQHHYNPTVVQLLLTLRGNEDHPAGDVEYSRDLEGLEILDWRVTIITPVPLEVLHDEDDHMLNYYDPDIRAWISGRVILMTHDLLGAELGEDGETASFLYHLNGLGNPNRPRIEWS